MAKSAENQTDKSGIEVVSRTGQPDDFQTEMIESAPAPDEAAPVENEPALHVGKDGGNREAARYRTRLREVEAERDTLREQLTAMRRHEVEQAVSVQQLKPAALWAAGVELADLLDDDGVPDSEKISTAIQQTREALGIPSLPKSPGDFASGNVGEPIPFEATSTPTWGDVIRR